MSAQTRDRTRRDNPLTAGDHLRAELERLGLSQGSAGRALGVSRQTINNIVTGRQPISRAMAAKLGRITGRGADYWLQGSFGGVTARALSAPAGSVLLDHQIVRAIEGGVIGVTGFDIARVRKASLDLTLGAVMSPSNAKDVRGVRVARGRSVRVVTGERIALPFDHLARIGAPPDLARRGAVAAHALHVDPGFDGKLEVCIFNAGDRDLVLKTGEPVVSLEIVPLVAAPAPAVSRRRIRR